MCCAQYFGHISIGTWPTTNWLPSVVVKARACQLLVSSSSPVRLRLTMTMSQLLWDSQHARTALHHLSGCCIFESPTDVAESCRNPSSKSDRNTGTGHSVECADGLTQTARFTRTNWFHKVHLFTSCTGNLCRLIECDGLLEQPPATQIRGILTSGPSTLFTIWQPSSTSVCSRLYVTRRK